MYYVLCYARKFRLFREIAHCFWHQQACYPPSQIFKSSIVLVKLTELDQIETTKLLLVVSAWIWKVINQRNGTYVDDMISLHAWKPSSSKRKYPRQASRIGRALKSKYILPEYHRQTGVILALFARVLDCCSPTVIFVFQAFSDSEEKHWWSNFQEPKSPRAVWQCQPQQPSTTAPPAQGLNHKGSQTIGIQGSKPWCRYPWDSQF